MHTQITLDDQLIQQATELTGLTNPQDIIEMALRELIARQKSDPLAKAFGQYRWEGDLETMRNDQCYSRTGIKRFSRYQAQLGNACPSSFA